MNSSVLEMTKGLNYKIKPFSPGVSHMPDQKMIIVKVNGDPSKETERVMGPLYATAYAIRRIYKDAGMIYSVEKLRGRWPAENMSLPKSQWTGIYGLPVPNDVTELPEIKKGKIIIGVEVKLTTWEYGHVGQILHVGPYSEEWPTIQKLHEHVESNGYKVIPNSHEEIYLTNGRGVAPDKMKTILLCRFQK